MTESPTAVTWPPETPCGPRWQAGSDDAARGAADLVPDGRGATDDRGAADDRGTADDRDEAVG
jgi:hypothetical protein